MSDESESEFEFTNLRQKFANLEATKPRNITKPIPSPKPKVSPKPKISQKPKTAQKPLKVQTEFVTFADEHNSKDEFSARTSEVSFRSPVSPRDSHKIFKESSSNLIVNERKLSRDLLNSSFLFTRSPIAKSRRFHDKEFSSEDYSQSPEKEEIDIVLRRKVDAVATVDRPSGSLDTPDEDASDESGSWEKFDDKAKEEPEVVRCAIIEKTSRIIQELLENEKSYIDCMKRGIEDYIVAYDSAVNLPNTLIGKRRNIFSNIERIFRFHDSIFLPKLVQCDFDPEKIACAFTSSIDAFDFDIYMIYVLNRKKSESICREHKEFFDDLQKDLLGINSFLIQPIQRLPRYQLMLGEIVNNLMKDLDEHKAAIAALCVAEKNIQRLLNSINEYC